MTSKELDEYVLRQFTHTLARFDIVKFKWEPEDRSAVELFHALTEYYDKSIGRPY